MQTRLESGTDPEQPAGSPALSPETVRPALSDTAKRRPLSRLLPYIVLVLFATACAVAIWPGRMSGDTLTQIGAVRSGSFTDWHASILLIIWRPFWLLGVGPTWVYYGSVLIFVVGLYATLRASASRVLAVAATMVIVSLPQVFGYVTYFGRDQWFLGLVLSSFGLLVKMARVHGRAKYVVVSLFLGTCWLLMGSRQNAAPVAGAFILAAVSLCGPWRILGRFAPDPDRPNTTLVARSVRTGVAVLILIVILTSQTALRSIRDVDAVHPEQQTYIFDLASLSIRENQNFLPPAVYPAQDLELLRARYNPILVNPLVFGPGAPISSALDPALVPELRQRWFDTILDHPRSYLATRWTVWERQMALRGKIEWVYHPDVDQNPWGYHFQNPSLQEPIDDYLRAFAANDYLQGGWVHEVWIYIVVTILGLGYFLSAGRERKMIAWLCLGSLAYQATIFVATMGVGYRLAWPSVVVALVVSVIAFGDVIALMTTRGRRSAPPRHHDQVEADWHSDPLLDPSTGGDDATIPDRQPSTLRRIPL